LTLPVLAAGCLVAGLATLATGDGTLGVLAGLLAASAWQDRASAYVQPERNPPEF
jgi:hypothetical protein